MQKHSLIVDRIEDLHKYITEQFEKNFDEHKDVNGNIEKVSQRVKKLELWRSFVFGGVAISSSVIGIIWTLFTFIYA